MYETIRNSDWTYVDEDRRLISSCFTSLRLRHGESMSEIFTTQCSSEVYQESRSLYRWVCDGVALDKGTWNIGGHIPNQRIDGHITNEPF